MFFRITCLGLATLGIGAPSTALAQVTVGPVSGGILVEAGGQGLRLESAVSGQFTVTVDAGAPSTNIHISPPTFVSGASNDPGGTSYTATADVDGTTITSSGTDDTTALATGSTTVLVDVQIERPSLFPAGSYQYTVDLTITP